MKITKNNMKKWFRKYWIKGLIFLIVFALVGVYSYKHWYVPYEEHKEYVENLKNGFVVVETFNCPKDHLIKANLKSMIYHLPSGTYYEKTNAANGYCFDNEGHAKQQGFRAPYN